MAKRNKVLIKIKRIYERQEPQDGFRVLVDHLWPRGLSKKEAKIDLWLKQIAPSHELRKKYCHKEAKWGEFQKLYRTELQKRPELLRELIAKAKEGPITLLFASKEKEKNNAWVLREYLEELIKQTSR